MRLTFNVRDPRAIKTFFTTPIQYLDIIILKESLFIAASNNVDLYSHMQFDIITLEGYEEPTYLRADKESFLAMLRVGHVSIYVDGEQEVEFGFHSEGYTTTVVRALQKSNVQGLQRFFELASLAPKGELLDLHDLGRYTTLLKNINSILTVDSGILHTSFGDGGDSNTNEVQLYLKTGAGDLTLYPSAVYYLTQRVKEIYRWKEFIIGYGDKTVIVLQNLVTRAQVDFEWLESYMKKREFLAEVDVSSVCSLAKSCNLDGEVVLDVNSETATFTRSTGRSKEVYKTKFKVHRTNSRAESRAAKILSSENPDLEKLMDNKYSSTFPRLAFRTGLFKKTLQSIPRTHLTISVCKRIVVFGLDGILFLAVGRHSGDN